MGQDVSEAPSISIGDFTLQVVKDFTYLGSTVSSNLSLDPVLNNQIRKAASIMAKLSKRVWENSKLTTATKVSVYNACMLSTLLCGNEGWTTYSHQERCLNSFHLCCLHQILVIL